MLFDADGKIKRYDSPEEIIREFFDLRLQYYERRRVSLLTVSATVNLWSRLHWRFCALTCITVATIGCSLESPSAIWHVCGAKLNVVHGASMSTCKESSSEVHLTAVCKPEQSLCPVVNSSLHSHVMLLLFSGAMYINQYLVLCLLSVPTQFQPVQTVPSQMGSYCHSLFSLLFLPPGRSMGVHACLQQDPLHQGCYSRRAGGQQPQAR